MILDSIDAYLVKQPSLVNHRKRMLLPVVLQRQQLADALARYMTQVGLEKNAKQIPLLSEYLVTKQQDGPNRHTTPTKKMNLTKEAPTLTPGAAAPAPDTTAYLAEKHETHHVATQPNGPSTNSSAGLSPPSNSTAHLHTPEKTLASPALEVGTAVNTPLAQVRTLGGSDPSQDTNKEAT